MFWHGGCKSERAEVNCKGMRKVDNDKLFSLYALTLVAGVASVITASVMAGVAALPTLGVFLEHLALSLAFRGAYKSFGGFEWIHTVGQAVGFITAEAGVAEPEAHGARA